MWGYLPNVHEVPAQCPALRALGVARRKSKDAKQVVLTPQQRSIEGDKRREEVRVCVYHVLRDA